MLKYCARCGKFHDINYRHPDYNRHKGNAVDRFHQSSEWTAKSLEIRERDHFMENRESIEGLDTVDVGLGAVLYDTKNHTYYTPNTDTTTNTQKGGSNE